MKKIEGRPLTELQCGDTAVIRKLGEQIKGPQRRRLLDLGVVPGVKISHQLNGPAGNTMAYEVLDSVIALRKEQTDHILISPEV